MSLKAQTVCPIPQETIRVAQAAHPKETLCTRMRDELGNIYTDEQFAALFSKDSQP